MPLRPSWVGPEARPAKWEGGGGGPLLGRPPRFGRGGSWGSPGEEATAAPPAAAGGGSGSTPRSAGAGSPSIAAAAAPPALEADAADAAASARPAWGGSRPKNLTTGMASAMYTTASVAPRPGAWNRRGPL